MEQTEGLRFPEPRAGLPEDPRPFMGSPHFAAAAALQEHLSARCLLAVVGPPGAGKSTVCRRAANSRWARHWFLQDESGHPVHRRFWVDLEDAVPGADTEERVARAVARPTFTEALDRVGNGRPCLVILDNADHAFGDDDGNETLARLVACVSRGASIVISRRSVTGLTVARPWTDVIEVSGFESHDEGRQLFDHLAPRHASDFRTVAIVKACDRLPMAVNLLARASAGSDLEAARVRIGSGDDDHRGLAFALDVAGAMVDAVDHDVWVALSLFPAGLTGEDISEVLAAVSDARQRALRLFALGVAQRCEAGVRIPSPLRLPASMGHLDDVGRSNFWQSYVRRALAVVGPVPDSIRGGNGKASPSGAASRGSPLPRRASPAGDGAGGARPDRVQAADGWLTCQAATLNELALRPSLPDGAFDLACAGLLIHQSGVASDTVDRLLVGLIERSLAGGAQRDGPNATAQTALVAAALEDQRRFDPAVAVTTALIGAHSRNNDTRGEAVALCQLGRAERFRGHYPEATAQLAEARRRFEKLDDGVGQGSALFELGQVALDLGRLDDAEAHLAGALALFEANGRPVGAANANIDLVRVDLARGRLDVAERRLRDALDRYQDAGDKLGFANACLQLGQVELARGRLDSAERHFGGALDGYEQAADKVGFANACLQLGQVELARGRLDSASRRFRGALAGYEQVGDKVGVANASLQLGQIDLAAARPESAALRFRHALAAYEELGDRIGVANASLQLGQVNLGIGELDEADQLLGAAKAAYDEIGDQIGSANSRQVEAILRQAQERPSQAMALFAEAARLYSALGRTAAAGWSLAGAARACTGKAERMGYAAEAVRLLGEAGLNDAAAQLAVALAEPEPKPEPEPDPPKVVVAPYEPWPAMPPPPDWAGAEAPPHTDAELLPESALDAPPARGPAPSLDPPRALDSVPSLDASGGLDLPSSRAPVAPGSATPGFVPEVQPGASPGSEPWLDMALTFDFMAAVVAPPPPAPAPSLEPEATVRAEVTRSPS